MPKQKTENGEQRPSELWRLPRIERREHYSQNELPKHLDDLPPPRLRKGRWWIWRRSRRSGSEVSEEYRQRRIPPERWRKGLTEVAPPFFSSLLLVDVLNEIYISCTVVDSNIRIHRHEGVKYVCHAR